MPKRKREEEKYRKKYKKLKKQIYEAKENRASSPESSSSETAVPSPPPSPEPLADDHVVTGAEDENLDESIIKALGQAMPTEKQYGPDVHAELVRRVDGVITQGLKQETKDDLIKKYLIPMNTKLLDAPKLNKELEGLLSETIKARDKRIEDRQQQIGVATAALISTTNTLIKEDVDKLKLIAAISDVTQLLLDLHHEDTVTRKKLIIPNLEKSIAKTVEKLACDEYLFGSKFTENVKNATAIKKSASNILKQNTTRKNISSRLSNQPQYYPKKQGNYKGPPQLNATQFKQKGRGRYQHHQQALNNSQKPRPPQRAAKSSVRQT